MEPILVILLIFSAVSMGIVACFQLFSAYLGKDNRLRHRFDNEFRKKSDDLATPSPLFRDVKEMDLEAATVWPNEGEDATSPRRKRAPKQFADRVRAWLKKADVSIGLKKLLILCSSVGIGFAVLVGILLPLPVAGVCFVLGFIAPLLIVEYKRRRRREQIIVQLPNAFDLMARVIRAGQSVPQALLAVAETLRGPIADEFGQCQHQQSMGLRPEIAFYELAQRNDIVELRIFSMAMLIQRQVGGNLTDVLDRLSKMIRDRLQLRRKVKTLTAEGRLQAITLLALPFLMFGVMMFINRDYAEVLLEHPSLIAGTMIVMALGAVWIRKIVNFQY